MAHARGPDEGHEYEFTIVAIGVETQTDDFANRLFEAGGNDATVAYQAGEVILTFHRRPVG